MEIAAIAARLANANVIRVLETFTLVFLIQILGGVKFAVKTTIRKANPI